MVENEMRRLDREYRLKDSQRGGLCSFDLPRKRRVVAIAAKRNLRVAGNQVENLVAPGNCSLGLVSRVIFRR